MTEKSTPDHHYRPDIDGLRAVAVLSVVIFHAFPTVLPGGFVGVDIFFVISGYLITGIIAHDLRRGRFSFLDFYAKRARRIFPALVLVISVCLAVGSIVMLSDEFALLGKHTAGGSAFVANLVLMGEFGYFDISSRFKPLLHLWSLGVEEQFYFVWPAALVGAAFLHGRLLYIALGIFILSFGYSVWLTGNDPNQAFYLPHSRFWELMAGAMLALSQRATKPGLFSDLMSAAGLALIVLAFVIVREGAHFPAPAAILPAAGSVFVIAAGHAARPSRLVLANPLAVGIGLISYPLYLWHWPLLSFPSVVLSGDVPRLWRIVAVLAAVVLAAATFWFVEKPIRKAGKLWKVALVWSLLLVVMFVAGLAVFLSGGFPSRPNVANFEAGRVDQEGAEWRYAKNNICMENHTVPGLEAYAWWFCMQNRPGEPDVLLIGDSFANHYYAGLVAAPEFNDATILSIGTCEPSYLREDEIVEESGTQPCTPARKFDQQSLIDQIIAEASPSIVIMNAMGVVPGGVPYLSEIYSERIVDRVGQIRAAGSHVVVILPHIRSTYPVRGCFARPLLSPTYTCEISRETIEAFRAGSAPLALAVHRKFPEVVVFDPNGVFCSDEQCSFVLDGRPMFRDEYDHFTIHASEVAVRAMIEQIRSERPDFLSQF